MTRRTAVPLLVVCVLSAALSACSGSEPEAAPDPKPAYVKAASAVCTSADEQFSELVQPTTPDAFGPFVSQTVVIAEKAQADLSALTPPPDDEADFETKVLDPFADLVAEGKAFSAKVTAAGSDQAALLALLGQRPTSEAVDKEYLRSYGLKSCADAVSKVG